MKVQIEDILENISAGFFALNSNYHITYWNKWAEKETRLSSADVLGKHIFEVFPNAERDELGEKYRLAMESQTFQTLSSPYLDENYEVWYDFRIYPSSGGLSVFLQDVTETKRAELQREMQLRVSRLTNTSTHTTELYNGLADILAEKYSIPAYHVLVYAYRSQGNQLMLTAPELPAPEWEEKIGTIPLEMSLGLACVDAVLKRSPIVTDDISHSVYYSWKPDLVVTRQKRTIIAIPLLVGDELIGVIELLLSRSLKSAEAELSVLTLIANEAAIGLSRRGLIDELRAKNIALDLQRMQTQDANDTLKRFLAFFSHELRSPLNSIIGFSDLIVAEFEKLEPSAVKEYISSIHSSGSHLLALINDILDLSKLEAGKMELHFDALFMKNFFENVIKILRPLIEKKKLTVEVKISDEVEDILADDVRLKQIIINLLSNAIKFSHDGGTIVMGLRHAGLYYEFSIQDFGLGISQSDAEKIFLPFHQSLSSSAKGEGTGLGLSVTKKLVDLHGGSIGVVSELGRGSNFIVRLPIMVRREKEDAAENNQKQKSILSTSSRKVLIVEDKTHARQILETYLSEAGYEIETASNGIEALEKAKTWKPDVITLDILLPMKDGWQVLRELKDHPLCKNIPVIIVSMVDERNVGFGLGAVQYLVKPVQKQQLIDSVKTVLEKSASGPQHAKILVIDDDQAVTDLLKVILESEGCQVVVVHDGMNGIESAETEQPDLIILDLMMPDITGFDVAHQLKLNPATCAIPVMVMTSMDIDDEIKEKLQGFVVTLMKKSGFTKKDLLQEIAAIDQRKSGSQPTA